MDLLFCLAFGGGFTFLYINMEADAWSRVISWLPNISAVNLENVKSWSRGFSFPLQKKATSAATAVFVYSTALNRNRNAEIAKFKKGDRRKYYINYSYPMKGGA